MKWIVLVIFYLTQTGCVTYINNPPAKEVVKQEKPATKEKAVETSYSQALKNCRWLREQEEHLMTCRTEHYDSYSLMAIVLNKADDMETFGDTLDNHIVTPYCDTSILAEHPAYLIMKVMEYDDYVNLYSCETNSWSGWMPQKEFKEKVYGETDI